MKGPHDYKKLANALKEATELVAWTMKNESKSSPNDVGDMWNHNSLCVGMVHVLDRS